MASRLISQCTPSLQKKIKAFTVAMLSKGLPFIITCTSRTVKEQVALYAQGREDVFTVNALRYIAGMPPITKEQNIVVTWTLQSKHLIDLDDNNPENNLSRAVDFAIAKNNKPIWDLKVDVNNDQIPDYEQAGIIAESVGLRWGGRFRNPDRSHLEDIE